MLNNINILILVKNNYKLNICIIDKINNYASNNVDEITIVIIQIVTKIIIFLNYENLCDE